VHVEIISVLEFLSFKIMASLKPPPKFHYTCIIFSDRLLAFEVASMIQQISTCIASSNNSTPSTSIIPPSMDHDQIVATIAKKFTKK
jgi:hypothetical protein